MCTGLEPLMLPAMGLGAGLSAASAYSSSQASKAAYNAQAQVDQNNARLKELQAQDAERRGALDAQNVGYRTNQVKGTQRANLAAQGVDLGFGSALEILSDTDYFGSVDRATTVDNAARQAWGYRVEASNYQSASALQRQRAASESPFLAAGTSLLGSASRVDRSWFTGSGATSSGDGLSQGDRRRIGVY